MPKYRAYSLNVILCLFSLFLKKAFKSFIFCDAVRVEQFSIAAISLVDTTTFNVFTGIYFVLIPNRYFGS